MAQIVLNNVAADFPVYGSQPSLRNALFGKVVATFTEPGVYSLWPRIGVKALLVPLLGKRYVLDLRIATKRGKCVDLVEQG